MGKTQQDGSRLTAASGPKVTGTKKLWRDTFFLCYLFFSPTHDPFFSFVKFGILPQVLLA